MPHDRQHLLSLLNQLQAELASLEDVDSEVRQRLEDSLSEIESALASEQSVAEAAESDESLAYRLGEAARHFEETHPTLTGMVGSVIDTLGRMGI